MKDNNMKNNKKPTLWELYLTKEISIEFKACLYFFAFLFFYCMYSLRRELDVSYGICESQEGFMRLVQMPECGGFNLTWADRLRKAIAKKNPKDFDQLTKEYYTTVREKNLSYKLCDYVWRVCVGMSRGYGFRIIESLYGDIQ